MPPTRLRPVAAALTLVLAAVLAARATGELEFAAPVKLNTKGWGFEPTIDSDRLGNLYVTAHKASATNEEARLSSFIWHSSDHGATWSEMPSPLQMHDELFSFEGDTALDANDRLYYVDTYGPDLWFSTWASGPAWERTVPLVTPSLLDDRPWLAAHGDGIVYLMTTDVATHARAEDGLAATPGSTSWAITPVLWRSIDGGETWTQLRAFNGAHYCGLGASPLDDVTVTVVCADFKALRAYESTDRGTTWRSSTVHSYAGNPAPMLSVAFDGAGVAYTAFLDVVSSGNKVYVARTSGSGWSVDDVTPFTGSFREVWVTAGAASSVGIGFYGSSDLALSPSSEWHVYGGLSADASSSDPTWSIARVDPNVVIHGPIAPPDFMQVTMDPSGTLFVAYSRETTSDLAHAPPPNFDHDIYVARQVAGP